MKKQYLLATGLMMFGSCAIANDFHPDFPLLDRHGNPVIETGNSMSTASSCGACHDTAYIAASSDHADAGAAQLGASGRRYDWAAGPGFYGGWDPLRYDRALGDDGNIDTGAWLKLFGSRHIGGGPVADLVEMYCLLCHSDITDHSARNHALQQGNYEWANSASLMQKDILRQAGGSWQWNPEMFQADGSLNQGVLSIRKPRDENCAQCHGQVDDQLETPLTVAADLSSRYMTDRTGQIFSPQKISHSGLNIAGKDTLNHAFDVHSDRVVGCVDCHYSLNNPVYFQQRKESRPVHLEFDPRRLTIADYLKRPMHQFAKGKSTLGLAARESENSLRRCESCHDAGNVHDWLPYKQRHFNSLACESCHIPGLYGPALQSLDWTLVDQDGQPRRRYRGIEGDPATARGLIHGYRPVLLARDNLDGKRKLAPFNLVSSWYWLAGEPARPVSKQELLAALYQGEKLHPELLSALDDNGNGSLDGDELVLITQPRLMAVRKRLEAGTLNNVHLAGEVAPFSINHNVVNGQWATRDCSSCHGEDSILVAAFKLSDYMPGGVPPAVRQYPGVGLSGSIDAAQDGSVSYVPDSRADGFYIIGLHNIALVDILGLLMFFSVLFGVIGHAMARYYFSLRRGGPVHHASHRVYMYDKYERLWHWLQAMSIMMLLATGLIIHKPHIFGMFSFAYVVQVHNVLGFILLVNAALALFYNLVSGEIRQYLPEPRGFIGRSIAQAMYYSRGIFAGEPHPLEKTREHKLNPLQQVTYLGILNVLLPAQVITGVLIWGLQEWPQLAAMLGGLPILAPIHTLLAWAFAAFIVLHVYLTTVAGETPGAGIKSMISGWEDVEDHAPEAGSKELKSRK